MKQRQKIVLIILWALGVVGAVALGKLPNTPPFAAGVFSSPLAPPWPSSGWPL